MHKPNSTARSQYMMCVVFCFLRGRRLLYYNVVSVAVTVLLSLWLLHFLKKKQLQQTVLFSSLCTVCEGTLNEFCAELGAMTTEMCTLFPRTICIQFIYYYYSYYCVRGL